MDDGARPPAGGPAFLAGGGEMGALMRGRNWSATPLGPVEAWPQSLRVSLGLCLGARGPIAIFWGERHLLLYNDAYREAIGDKHPHALGRPAREVHLEIWDTVGPMLGTVLATGAAVGSDGELLPLLVEGKLKDRWFDFTFNPLVGEGGQVEGVLNIVVETTERVRLERALLQGERRLKEVVRAAGLSSDFRALFEAAPIPLLVLEPPDWTIVAANDAYLEVTGTTREGTIGRRLFEAFPDDPDDPGANGVRNLGASLHRVLATKAADIMALQRYAVRDPGGHFVEHWWSPVNTPVLGQDGEVALVIHRAEEVTDLVRLRGEADARDQIARDQQAVIDRLRATDAALRESEAALRAANVDLERKVTERALARGRTWQLSPEIMGVLNAEGRFEQSNPAWAAALGWSEAEVASTVFFDFIHPDDLPRTRDAWTAAIERGEPALDFENRYRTKDGRWRWLSWIAVPDDGKVYCSARDVTAEKEQAEALAQAEGSLRQSQKLDSMGSLTGGVAHDFNNLLTPILAVLDRLQRQGLGSERERRLIDGALQSAERAKALVQRLLAFARRQPLQSRAVDIGTLVRGMADLVASTTGPRVNVRVELPSDLPPALADANQLEMAVLNLAVNARDAMPEGGVLTITAARESVREQHHAAKLRPGHYVRLSVADTGIGMDEATLVRAVEPFFSTKGVGRGTGLGLSMVHGLASQLNGGLTITSRPGKGTTVELWLPISAVAVEEGSDAPSSAAAHKARGTALLVDDEDLVRMSTADMLSEFGYEVLEASSAEEALRLVGEGLAPDLVVTDHLMPGLSGADLARDLLARRPDLPVLIVSGYADVEGIAPGLPRLTKPFRSAELAASLAALIPGGTE